MAIIEYKNLPQKAEYTDAEKLIIYREHKLLTRAIQIAASGNIYNFILRTGENQGYQIEGTITPSGKITEVTKTTSSNI